MSKSKPGGYEIPLHKCQVCYYQTGRYILDCYCVVCQHCFKPSTEAVCSYCHKSTNNRKLDTKDEGTYEKVGMMFGRPEFAFNRGIEILKFQTNIANRYAEYLEGELKLYKNAVYDLVRSNPRLDKYFFDRIKGFRVPPKSTTPGQRSKSQVIDHRSKKSGVTIVETRRLQDEPRKPKADQRQKPREKEREKERERPERQRDRQFRNADRERDQRRPSLPPQPLPVRNHLSKQQPQPAIQPKQPSKPPKYSSDQSQNKESYYNWQDRLPKNQYYGREDEEVQNRDFNGYHRPKSRSRSGSDMPSSSYMGKRSSGPKEFLAHGLRRRI